MGVRVPCREVCNDLRMGLLFRADLAASACGLDDDTKFDNSSNMYSAWVITPIKVGAASPSTPNTW